MGAKIRVQKVSEVQQVKKFQRPEVSFTSGTLNPGAHFLLFINN
jgi:hypothetical protein